MFWFGSGSVDRTSWFGRTTEPHRTSEFGRTRTRTRTVRSTTNDFIELCKLYDKNENGTMMLAELENILCNLGDMIPKEDTGKMLDELAGAEDEDGFIPYKPFVDKLCGKA